MRDGGPDRARARDSAGCCALDHADSGQNPDPGRLRSQRDVTPQESWVLSSVLFVSFYRVLVLEQQLSG
jgi:hypothetical protein